MTARASLLPLWRSDTIVGFPRLLYPTDVHFFDGGLAVFDYAEKRLHVLRAATGQPQLAVGRKGPGPAEFGDRPVWLFGANERLTMVEATDGRVAVLDGRDLRQLPTTTRRRWMSGCAWGDDRLLFQELGHDSYDYFVTRREDSGRAVDSVPTPWPRLRALSFMVRQAKLRQLDDTTCAVLPVYHREIAVWSASSQARVGLQIEQLPEVRSIESRSARMRRSTIAPGARGGAVDARRWKNSLLVLFEGTTALRRRLLDVYDWSTLRYRGSVVLPFEASRFATRGDTLVLIEERDDEPVVSAYLLRDGSTRE